MKNFKNFLVIVIVMGILLNGCSSDDGGLAGPSLPQATNPVQGQSGYLNLNPDLFASVSQMNQNTPPYFTWIYPENTATHMVVTWGRSSAYQAVFFLGDNNLDYNIGVYTNKFSREMHSFVCDNLSPETVYYFKVTDLSGDEILSQHSFKTPPASGSFSFILNSDSRPRWTDPLDDTGLRQTVAALTNDPVFNSASFIMNTGDIVNWGNAYDWNKWLNDYWAPILCKLPIVPTTGNHDYDEFSTSIGRTQSYYKDMFSLPGKEWYYTLNFGRSRFIILDTGYNSNPAADSFSFRAGQSAFIDAELTRAQQDKDSGTLDLVFLCFHNCIGSIGSHADDSYVRSMLTEIRSKISQYEVDMLLTAHDHTYQRNVMDGITYIVNGVGGAYRDGANGSMHPTKAPHGLVNQFFTNSLGFNLFQVDGKKVSIYFQDISGLKMDEVSYKQKTVYYHNPRSWSAVYMRFANVYSAGNPVWTPYPGRRMRDMGNGWFKSTILVQENSSSLYKLECSFNNGANDEDDDAGQNYSFTDDEKYVEGWNPTGDVPIITITSPQEDAGFTNTMTSVIEISANGTAVITGGFTITNVQLSLNGGPFANVSGTAAWSTNGIPLLWAQTNVLQVRAFADNGSTNTSALVFISHHFQPVINLDGIKETVWDAATVYFDSPDDADSKASGNLQLNLTNVYVTNDVQYLYFGFDTHNEIWGKTIWYIGIDKNTSAGATNLKDNFSASSYSTNTYFVDGNLPDYVVIIKYDEDTGDGYDGLFVKDASGQLVHAWDTSSGKINQSNRWGEVRVPLSVLSLTQSDSINFWFVISQDYPDKPFFDSIPRLGAECTNWSTSLEIVTNIYNNYTVR